MAGETAPPSRIDKLRLFGDLGYEPHPGQLEVHRSLAPRRVVACGVRWGKSTLAAMEAIAAAMEPRERAVIWICAPTYELSEKVFREIVVKVAEHLQHRIVTLRENDKRLVIRNMAGGISEIRGKSADNPVSLLGEGLDFLVVDEAATLRPAIWQSYLSQRLLDKQGTALLISTPKGKGYFFDLYRSGQGSDPDYESWNYPSWTSPLLDARLIDRERGRLPERVFQEQYGAQFVEGSGQVFRNVRECATGEWQDPVPDDWYFAGLDIAKVEDYTVLAIANQRRELVYVDRFHRIDWGLQIQRVKAAYERYRRPELYIDSTGKGEPIHEALCREGIYADAYPFTAKSKAALIDKLSLLLERRSITLPRPELWPEGIDELEAFQFSVTGTGNVRSSAPSGMHDDCVCALALAMWGIPEEGSELRFFGPFTADQASEFLRSL